MVTAEALDRAYAGEPCEFVRADGTTTVFAIDRWTRDASASDLDLFVDRCHGPTLDVGCGPGRLTGALADRGLPALGIDISDEAVRQTRERGGTAIRHDVFDAQEPTVRWQHILLADGNIGLGGDPHRLLGRVSELLSHTGTLLVELTRGTHGSAVHERVRLRVGRQMSASFTWATVGVDTIHDLATRSGLVVTEIRHRSGRVVATLEHDHLSFSGPEPR